MATLKTNSISGRSQSSSSSSSSFSFTMACEGNAPFGIVGAAGTFWNWTVNGVEEDGGFTSCNTGGGGFTVTGSGVVPSNANGIVASMDVHRGSCGKTVSTSKSISSAGKVSIKLAATCNGIEERIPVSIEASFILKS